MTGERDGEAAPHKALEGAGEAGKIVKMVKRFPFFLRKHDRWDSFS